MLNHPQSRQFHRRAPNGAALGLVLALLGGVAISIAVFSVNYTGLVGNYHEQRSAIEAAALTAAKDLSSIVIDDPNFGLIGVSDFGPTGSASQASDGYYTCVTGINTLFGRIRLDLIIADYLQDPIMEQLALDDYYNALAAQSNLLAAINAAMLPGGTFTDVNGNILNPTQDATNTYNANSIHLVVNGNCTLVPNSLHITLGYVNGLTTRTPIPQPSTVASLSASQQSQGFYAPNQVINYVSTDGTTTPFVFASLGPNATLVDYRIFRSRITGLTYSTPSVVKVDADEQYAGGTVIHSTAAAMAGTIVDQRPNPGALTISFPNGPVPEITQLGDLINCRQLQADPIDALQTPLTGDYPAASLANCSMPFLPDVDPAHPNFENVLSVALYDWVKRGGTNVNVQSLVTMLQTPMSFGSAGPQMQRFHITSSGTITNDAISWGNTNLCVSQRQYRAISGLGINSTNGNNYDLQITDFAFKPGRTNGGLHAGEPLDSPGTSASNPLAGTGTSSTMYENINWPYEEFLPTASMGAPRPSYLNEGIAVDVTLRKRQ